MKLSASLHNKGFYDILVVFFLIITALAVALGIFFIGGKVTEYSDKAENDLSKIDESYAMKNKIFECYGIGSELREEKLSEECPSPAGYGFIITQQSGEYCEEKKMGSYQ